MWILAHSAVRVERACDYFSGVRRRRELKRLLKSGEEWNPRAGTILEKKY